MRTSWWAAGIAIGLFFGTVACFEAGFRWAIRKSGDRERAREGVGAIEGAVFALFGLLLAFSFAVGMTRLDSRRELIVQEANAIGTAYLRLDLLPAKDQPELRHLFREYLNARLAVYASLPDLDAARREYAQSKRLQDAIWTRAVTAANAEAGTTAVKMLLLPALNQMIDITTSRTVAFFARLPLLIWVMLVGVALLSALLAGYTMAQRGSRSWLHIIVFALASSVTIYAIGDLDDPRSGSIRLDTADRALSQLRDSIR